MQTIIQTPSPNLDLSLDFYTRLQFQPLPIADRNVFSDGKVLIEISKDPKSRKGLVVYSQELKSIVQKISDNHSVVIQDETSIVSDPSGNLVYLKHGSGIDFNHNLNHKTILGNSYGLCLEVIELDPCIALYQHLGFSLKLGSSGEGWVMMENEEGFSLSLMALHSCPHIFPGASISYFNGKKNPEIIEHIRRVNIPIYEEITTFNVNGEVDNVILQDPGGLGFFVFNDE